MELLKQQIEALIFCSEQSISLEEIAASLKISFDWELEDAEIIAAIEDIKSKYYSEEFSFELVEISEGYQFLTKKQYYPAISALIQHKARKKLSVSQMETLAIIAYRQPIAKSEVEHIRGVSCDYAVQKLLEKELVEISGKSDGPGRPVLYSTSRSFMDYFGIKSVKDLPQLKDLHVEQNEIGQTTEESSENIQTVPSFHEDILVDEPSDEINIGEAEVSFGEKIDNPVDNEFDPEDFSEIPDRKSIFIENELRSEEEEINEEEKSEKEDPNDFI